MKTKTYRNYLPAGLFLAAAVLSARSGSFFSDFNSGALPPGTHTNANSAGGAYLDLTGGVGNSGCFKITKNINGQNGSLILDDLDSGSPIYGFDISFNVRIGGGTSTPADGFAFVVAPDITDTSLWGETGTGSGICFTWSIYTGSSDSQSGLTLAHPDLCVRQGGGPGTIVAYQGYTVPGMETGGTDPSTWWSTVHIRLNPDGSLNFDFKGVNVFTNFFIPGYQAFANLGLPVRFGVSGRTGGLNENFWIDNLSITTFTNPMVGISQAPISQTVQQGDNATFNVAVGNNNGVTYQWYSNNVTITGATSASLVVSNVQPAMAGSHYKVTATGPNNSVTSAPVTLSVTNLPLPSSPQLSFNFDDGLVPAGTAVSGSAYVTGIGGVGNSGCLHLTDALNGQSGALIISDPNAGAPVYGFTARFNSLEGGGSVPPADGFTFAFGNDIPATPSGNFENGAGLGTGLIVGFDIFDNTGILGALNGEGPDPSIAVFFGGQKIAQTQKEPVSFMETGVNFDGTPGFDDTIIQLNTDGTLTVVYRGAVVFDHLLVPGFASIAGASYALAARTGGLNENQWVDNIQLTTVTTPGAVRITQQPTSQTILVNHSYTNTVAVNDPAGVTYQWYRGTSLISGATDSTYTIASVATGDNGASFTVQATKSSVTVTSAPVTLTVANLTPPTSPQLSFNFDDGLVPANTAIYGNTSVSGSGGVGGSGVLHLTDAINSQNGAFVMQPVFGGAQVSAISVAFDVREGGGSSTPADGFSFNWASTLTDGTVGGAEAGVGNGFSLCFRIYVGNGNADNPPSPYIAIKYKGNFIASTQIPAVQLDTGSDFRTMLLRVDPDGKVYLAYGERVIYNGLQLPNYTVSAGKFGFYGRTGGLNENQWFDNIRIQATQSSGPLTITAQPANATVIAGQTATFNVSVSDPNGATYQWYRNNSLINAATTSSYTTPPTATTDNGALFKVIAHGPSGTATSSNAVLTVVAPITISNPLVSYNFDDCGVPFGTTLTGSADAGFSPGGYIASGGIGNSCCLHLTDAMAQGEHGTFIVPDLNSNEPVKAFTVYFAALIGGIGATVPPADGISLSFVSSNEVPVDAQPGEGGIGNGLIVIFDLFNGGNPYFGITYHGASVVRQFVDYTQMVTGNNFADTFIRLNANGTVDVQFNNKVIFNQVPLPGYTASFGYEYVLAGRGGGLWCDQWIDNLQIATTTGLVPVPLAFSVSGGNLRLTWNGDGFKLQSTASLNPANWQDVPGGTSSPYPATIAGPAQFYRLAPAP